MNKFESLIYGFLTFAVISLFIAIALGAPVMLLWNYIMPTIFGVIKINFWQALALNLLVSILFGRINFGGSDK